MGSHDEKVANTTFETSAEKVDKENFVGYETHDFNDYEAFFQA